MCCFAKRSCAVEECPEHYLTIVLAGHREMTGRMIDLDHPFVQQQLFFPRKSDQALRSADKWEVGCKDGAKLRCFYRAPVQARGKLIVHFHGNGELVSDYACDPRPDSLLALLYTKLGLGVCFVEFRGYGESSGSCSMSKMLTDVTAVREALAHEKKVEAKDIIVFGRSIGSLFAIHLAAQAPVAGLILDSGIGDPEAWAGARLAALAPALRGADDKELLSSPLFVKLHAQLQQLLDNKAKLAEFKSPLLVLHTKDDRCALARLHSATGRLNSRALC